jgi:peptide/nickel transport system substrate-binding protein
MPMDYFVPAKSHLNLTRQNTPAADEALARSHAIPVGEAKRGQALLSGLEAYHSAGASLPLAIPDMTFGLKKPMTINGFTNYWWMQRWDLLVGVNR